MKSKQENNFNFVAKTFTRQTTHELYETTERSRLRGNTLYNRRTWIHQGIPKYADANA